MHSAMNMSGIILGENCRKNSSLVKLRSATKREGDATIISLSNAYNEWKEQKKKIDTRMVTGDKKTIRTTLSHSQFAWHLLTIHKSLCSSCRSFVCHDTSSSQQGEVISSYVTVESGKPSAAASHPEVHRSETSQTESQNSVTNSSVSSEHSDWEIHCIASLQAEEGDKDRLTADTVQREDETNSSQSSSDEGFVTMDTLVQEPGVDGDVADSRGWIQQDSKEASNDHKEGGQAGELVTVEVEEMEGNTASELRDYTVNEKTDSTIVWHESRLDKISDEENLDCSSESMNVSNDVIRPMSEPNFSTTEKNQEQLMECSNSPVSDIKWESIGLKELDVPSEEEKQMAPCTQDSSMISISENVPVTYADIPPPEVYQTPLIRDSPADIPLPEVYQTPLIRDSPADIPPEVFQTPLIRDSPADIPPPEMYQTPLIRDIPADIPPLEVYQTSLIRDNPSPEENPTTTAAITTTPKVPLPEMNTLSTIGVHDFNVPAPENETTNMRDNDSLPPRVNEKSNRTGQSNHTAILMLLAMSNPGTSTVDDALPPASALHEAPCVPLPAKALAKRSDQAKGEIETNYQSSDSESDYADDGDDTYNPSSYDSESNANTSTTDIDGPSRKWSKKALSKKRQGEVNSAPYKKPYRLCPFCNTAKSKLSQHIRSQHKNVDSVAKALSLPQREQIAAMENFKKHGILKVNKEQAKTDKPAYQRERLGLKDDGLVMCCHCCGFYSKTYLTRHTRLCQGEACYPSISVPVHLLSSEADDEGEFVTNVLNKFVLDGVGKLCISDPVLLKIGQKLWYKQKQKGHKESQSMHYVMANMRRLSSLYLKFLKQEGHRGALPVKEGNLGDLFQSRNFSHLENAIEAYTSKEGDAVGTKSSVKIGLYYILKSASKILKATYLMDDTDHDAAHIDKFVAVLERNHDRIFGDVMHRKQCQRRAETPPLLDDIKALRLFTLQRMSEVSSSTAMDMHNFEELRDLVCCRLTLFNARRGGEPSRLLLQEWNDAEMGAWLDVNHLENIESLDRALESSLRIIYQRGKGNKPCVPLLFPEDTLDPIRKLCSEEWRSVSAIKKKNPYLFPTTNRSENHISGWHAVFQYCEKLALKEKSFITATKNRHRVSTLFALMDVPESDREAISKCLRLSEETCSKNQTPSVMKELTVAVKRLQTSDKAGDETVSTGTDPSKENRSLAGRSTETPLATPQKEASSLQLEDDTVSPAYDVIKARKYSKWTQEEADILRTYFKEYYDGTATKNLPGHKDALEFLRKHQTFRHDCKTIHSKVMNDIRLRKQKEKSRAMDLE